MKDDNDGDATLLLDNAGESIPNISDSCLDEGMPFLVVLNGFEKGKKILVLTAQSTLGRSPQCIIQIKDNRVSLNHAELLCECGKITIRDLASKNGTLVNNRRCEKADLTDGDRILLGSTELVITIPKK